MLLATTNRRFSIKYRLLYLAAGILVFLVAYSSGAGASLSGDDAATIRSEYLKNAQGIDQSGIFLNNVGAGLEMFIPGLGAAIGLYSGFSTGMTLHAFALASPELSNMNPLSILATPYGTLELFAYGLAISRSGMLVFQFVKKEQRTRHSLKQILIMTGIEIALVIAALVIGSVIESQIITANKSGS